MSLSETMHSFSTAYYVAKEKLAFLKINGLVELQEMNGVKTGSCHKSDHSCINIITHIDSKMKRKMSRQLKVLVLGLVLQLIKAQFLGEATSSCTSEGM